MVCTVGTAAGAQQIIVMNTGGVQTKTPVSIVQASAAAKTGDQLAAILTVNNVLYLLIGYSMLHVCTTLNLL